MRKVIPTDAVIIPAYAAKVFEGVLFSVYQWGQTLYDGSVERFEMLKRPDSVYVIAIKDNTIVVLNKVQPGREPFLSLPGGRVQANEDPMQTAARNLTEQTGLVFDTFRLVSVKQHNQKIEWFSYMYIAKNYRESVAPIQSNAERVETLYFTFEEFSAQAKDNQRLGGDFIATFNNLDEVALASTFQGLMIDR